ncbi:CGNR zinc finger domain-containing protein [Streptomyces sp. NPDC059917]|uniref:CGNR zinc finger domain-containing protein n=1 Tax=Streptomyces sp. NPDC059917 TaxID=3347002 RepID=UPI0036639041
MTVTFPLLGEPLALDLVNTSTPAVGDLIADPAGLAAWLDAQPGRLTPLAAPATGAELARVHAVRGAAREALEAVRRGEEPPVGALRVLNEALAAAPAHRELGWTPAGGLTAAVRLRATDPGRRLAAELAGAVADLLTDPRVADVRGCEGVECALLFLPANPRRRWCVAALCGNRARVARHYARHTKGEL